MKLEILDSTKTEAYVGTEPVSLIEAKAWCLIDFTDDDTLITSLITQSRMAIEDYCALSIVPKTIFLTARNPPPINANVNTLNYRWDASFYGWPMNFEWTELPWGPVAAVQSVTVINTDGTVNILAQNADWYLSGTSFIKMRINMWYDQILIQYFTPYYCPQPLKEAILNEIAFRYENRGAGLNRYAAQNVGASEGAQTLAKPYKRIWL
jgi:Phage gp6-like head-tail connector protein